MPLACTLDRSLWASWGSLVHIQDCRQTTTLLLVRLLPHDVDHALDATNLGVLQGEDQVLTFWCYEPGFHPEPVVIQRDRPEVELACGAKIVEEVAGLAS